MINWDNIFKVMSTIILGGALLIWVIPSIFWIIIKIFVELIVLISWLFIGYAFIKGLEMVWAPKKKE